MVTLAIAVLLLLAVGVYLQILFGGVVPIIQSIVTRIRCALRGEKTPSAKRREELERLRAGVMSEEEAKERARAYAKANGCTEALYFEPFDIRLCFSEDKNRKEGEPLGRFSYLMYIGSAIPAPLLEMDATDGTILQWKTFPR